MNINEQLNAGQKDAGINSTGYFKFKEGENRIRILTAGEVIATHFFGKGQKAKTCYGMEKGCPYHGANTPLNDKGQVQKPSIKYTCYVSKDNIVELADLPYSVMKQVGDFQENIDYKFEIFPMPYDITVKFDSKAGPNDMYKVIPSPKCIEVTPEVMQQLNEKMSHLTPVDSVAKKKSWQISEHDKDGTTAKRKEAFRASVASMPQREVEESIEYPTDEISPADIPF